MTRKVLLIFGLLLFEIFCYSLENKLTKDGVTDFFNPLKNSFFKAKNPQTKITGRKNFNSFPAC